MITCFPIAFLNVAPNLSNIIAIEEDNYKLAHYNIFYTEFEEESISSLIHEWIDNYDDKKRDFIVEGRIHLSSKTKSLGNGEINQNEWMEIELISIKESLPEINQVVLTYGKFPTTSDEITLLESFALADGINLNDKISLYTETGKQDFTVVGFAKSIEYASYKLSQVAVGYLNMDAINSITIENIDNKITSTLVYFNEEMDLQELRNIAEYIKENIDNLESASLALFWFSRDTSYRKNLLDALKLTSKYMTAASLFVFLTAGVIIFVITNRYVGEQKKNIGALYSFGVNKQKIIFSFFIRMFVLGTLGIILGIIIAKLLTLYIINNLADDWGLFSSSSELTPFSILFTLTSAAIVSFSSTFFAIRSLIKLTPYEAMRGKTTELKSTGIIMVLSTYLPVRNIRAAFRNLTRNRTRSFLTILAFALAFTLSSSLMYTQDSLDNTIYEFYDENIAFDLEIELGFSNMQNRSIIEQIIADDRVVTYEFFINNLIQFKDRPENLAYLLGFQYNSTLYRKNNANLVDGTWYRPNSSDIVVSKYVATSLNISKGDKLSFYYFDSLINGTVSGIATELLNNLAIMMDIEFISTELKNVFNLPTYNVLPVANKLLVAYHENANINDIQDDLNQNNPYVVLAVSKEHLLRKQVGLVRNQSSIVILMVSLGLIVGFVSFFSTLLISIVEREREFAIMKVYGYKNQEIILEILIEGMILGFFSIIPALFIGRFTAVNLWIKIVSDSFFNITPFYLYPTQVFLLLFGFISILISVIPSYILAISKPIYEVIREES